MIEKVTFIRAEALIPRRFVGSVDCDAGYLKKSKDLVSLAESGRFIRAATRQNYE